MFRGRFYILVLPFFLMANLAGASSRCGFPVHEKSYYTSMKEDLTKGDNEGICFALAAYKNNPNDEDFFQLCIGSYVCGNAAVRELMEEKLGDEEKFVAMKFAKDLVQKNEIEQNIETKRHAIDLLKGAKTNGSNNFVEREIKRKEEGPTLDC
jgi:hypothetical protein